MPHEAPLFRFRERPELAAELLRDALGVAVPEHAGARVEEADFTQIVPAAYHADLVVTLFDDGPVMGIVVETRLAPKGEKRFAWPLYVAALHAKLKCRTCLIVLVPTDEMARWASEPITTLQPGSPFVPLVLGPSRVPIVTSPEQAARSPEIAVLSALAHGRGEHGVEVARAALGAAAALFDEARRTFSMDLILSALGADARTRLELKMDLTNYEFQSEFFRSKIEKAVAIARAEAVAQGKAQGLAEAKAEGLAEAKAEGLAEAKAEALAHAILAVLEARGVAVSAEQGATILACGDAAVLDRRLARAATAAVAEDAITAGWAPRSEPGSAPRAGSRVRTGAAAHPLFAPIERVACTSVRAFDTDVRRYPGSERIFRPALPPTGLTEQSSPSTLSTTTYDAVDDSLDGVSFPVRLGPTRSTGSIVRIS